MRDERWGLGQPRDADRGRFLYPVSRTAVSLPRASLVRVRVHRCFACACLADRLRAETGLLNVELRPSGLILNVAGVARMLHMLPAWYAVASVLFTMPYAWAGGKLRERQLEHRGAVAPAIA